MRPCSPLGPTVLGLQLLSWRAIAARRMGGTVYEHLNINLVHRIIKSEIELTSVLYTKLLERPIVCRTVTIGTILGNSILEFHGDELGHLDVGRVPSTVSVDATVHPVNGSIRASCLSDLR
jgi:hypothetical protein